MRSAPGIYGEPHHVAALEEELKGVEGRLGTDEGNIHTNAKSAAKALQDAIAGLKAVVNGQLARLQNLLTVACF